MRRRQFQHRPAIQSVHTEHNTGTELHWLQQRLSGLMLHGIMPHIWSNKLTDVHMKT